MKLVDTISVLGLAAIAASAFACKRDKPSDAAEARAGRPSGYEVALAAPSTSSAQADLAEPASAAALPAPATPVAPPPAFSVNLSIQAGPDAPSMMPVAGKPATFTVAPIDVQGRLVEERATVLGATLVLVALRYDLSWVQVQRAEVFNQPDGKRHAFKVSFPQAGRHLLYFLFRPKGGELASTPVSIEVQGTAAPGVAWIEEAPRYAGPGGLEVGLAMDPAAPQPCAALHVATTWLRRSAPLPLQGGDTGRVLYLLLSESMGPPVASRPIAVALDSAEAATRAQAGAAVGSWKSLGGDLGSDGLLVPQQIGHHKLLAIGDVGGKGDSRVVTAIFGLSVTGAMPMGGCTQP